MRIWTVLKNVWGVLQCIRLRCVQSRVKSQWLVTSSVSEPWCFDMNPDPDLDPALFFSGFQDNQYSFLSFFWLITYCIGTIFGLLMEGSGEAQKLTDPTDPNPEHRLPVAKIIDFWLGDKVNSGIGLLYRPNSHVACGAGTTTLCRSWLYPPVRDLWIQLQVPGTW